MNQQSAPLTTYAGARHPAALGAEVAKIRNTIRKQKKRKTSKAR